MDIPITPPDYHLVPHYCQASRPWGIQFIGRTHETIRQVGCAESCEAMLIEWARLYFKLKHDSIDPGILDHWLTRNEGYIGAALIWDKPLEYAVDEIGVPWTATNESTWDDFINCPDWEHNSFPLVGVSYSDNGIVEHWVLLLAQIGNDWLINDPGHAKGHHNFLFKNGYTPHRVRWYW